MEKPDVLPIPNVVTINEFKVLLTSITCLPSYPIERRYLPYSSPYRVYMLHPTSKWPTRPLSHSLYPGYKSGLRAPLQRQFSLELARCSNSISHSNKLYFPLILSHVWKFFSNPHLDYDTCFNNMSRSPELTLVPFLPFLFHSLLSSSIWLFFKFLYLLLINNQESSLFL